MNLHDDNHLDELSRRAAEEFEPDHGLHSWDKLRPPLDAALPQKKERKRRFFFWLLLFLLVGGGTAYFTLWNGSSEQLSQEETVKNSGVPVAPTENKAKENEVNQNKTGNTPAAQVETNKSKTEPNKNKTVFDNAVPAEKETVTQKQPKKLFTDPKESKEPITETETPELITSRSAIEFSLKTTQPKKENLANKPKVEQPAPVAPAIKEDKKENKKQSPTLKNRWEFGLAFAPDVSTVKFTHTKDPGTNIGLTIGYNLSKHFQLQTGVFYTSKNYKTYGKDYHPPKGYWTDYVKLETVTGECDMWDIPLNIRYNIAPQQSSKFFASAGLSSYLMRKEDYDFFYYYNGNPVSRFRSYYTDNRHWFSVLNLSVGYERQVGKCVSLQAEPFFKQPLKGVGFGSIKLNSTGIYFSVKYKPFINKPQSTKK